MLKKLLPLKPDPIMGLVSKFKLDSRVDKINLTIGELYYIDKNKKHLFDYQFIINKLKVQKDIISNNSKYLPITGCPEFIKSSEKFIFGNNKCRHGVQTLSGTGSLTIGNHILELLDKDIYIPESSWANHFNIFSNHKKYKNINDIDNMKDSSVVLFHTCCNNPTGIDYTQYDWEKISEIMKRKNNIAFFDSAYIGLASGNLELDTKPIRDFENNNINYIVSTSYAKNFGLYGQRIGSLFYNFNDKEYNDIMNQHITKFIRKTYSNPPRAGAEMATFLMNDKRLMKKWNILIKKIIKQQKTIRKTLDNELGWNTKNKNGLFFMTPLTKEQIIELRENEAIYMLENGRINISGLDLTNIDKFIECVKKIQN